MKTKNGDKASEICMLMFVAIVACSLTIHFKKYFWLSLALVYLLSNYIETSAKSEESSGLQCTVKCAEND